MQNLSHVRTWVFDLDQTLYPPSDRLFDQIEVRMRDFVARTLGLDSADAGSLCLAYWRRYGTTLAGLMAEHGVPPEDFLVEVHDIDMGHLRPDPALAADIARLPGRRVVFTNGTRPYAERVLAARGLGGVFDAVYGVEHANFHPKPRAEAYHAVFAIEGLAPREAAMFEDDARNLAVPHAMGLRTVHVAPEPAPAPHIDHHTDDLARFLSHLP